MRHALSAALFLATTAPALAGTPLAIEVVDMPYRTSVPAGQTRLGATQELVKAFTAHNVPGAVGFVNGSGVDVNGETGDVLRAWLAGGYTLGNQSYNHLNLNGTTLATYIADVTKNQSVLDGFGAVAGKFFFYSYFREGETLDKQDAFRVWLSSHDFTVAQPTIWFEDWEWNDAYTRCVAKNNADGIAQLDAAFLSAAQNYLTYARALGSQYFGRDIAQTLVLTNGAYAAHIADRLLSSLESQAVTYVSVASAMTDPAFAQDPRILSDDDLSFLERVVVAKNGAVTRPDNHDDVLGSVCN